MAGWLFVLALLTISGYFEFVAAQTPASSNHVETVAQTRLGRRLREADRRLGGTGGKQQKQQKKNKEKLHKESPTKMKELMGQLKEDVARLENEKAALRELLKKSEGSLAASAREASDLAQQLSTRSNANPADTEEAKQNKELAQRVASQQKEIANLTGQLSELRIRHEELLERAQSEPSLRDVLASKASAVYKDPGIEGAANKTSKYVLPRVAGALRAGSEVYYSMNASVYEGLHSVIGAETIEPWLPAVSGFLVYGLICLPLGISLTCLAEFVCKLKELLLACSFYLCCISFLSLGFLLWTGKDPLYVLADQDASVYLLQQAGFIVVMLLHAALLSVATCLTNGVGQELGFRFMQLLLLGTFALFYYQLVWTPAMLDEMPQIDDFMSRISGSSSDSFVKIPYVLSTFIFTVIFLVEKYMDDIANKEQDEKEEKGA